MIVSCNELLIVVLLLLVPDPGLSIFSPADPPAQQLSEKKIQLGKKVGHKSEVNKLLAASTLMVNAKL